MAITDNFPQPPLWYQPVVVSVCPRCLCPYSFYSGPWNSITPPPVSCGCPPAYTTTTNTITVGEKR